MAQETAAVPVLTPLQTTILNILDARHKTDAAIAAEQARRLANTCETLSRYALAQASLAAINVDNTVEWFNAWKTSDDRFQQRILALETSRDKLDACIEDYSRNNRDNLIAALKARLVRLSQTHGQCEKDCEEIQRQISLVVDRLAVLEPAAKKDSPPPQTQKK